MNDWRLLVDIEVLEFLRAQSRHDQAALLKQFRVIAESPVQFSDFVEADAAGRRVDVHIFRKFAIKYWTDFADRHVKVLDLHLADRSA